MMDLLERVDPAATLEIDGASIRARTDEKLGISPPILERKPRRPWRVAVIGFAAVLAVVVPLVAGDRGGEYDSAFAETLFDIPGVVDSIGLPDGPVDMAAVDGTIWIATSTTGELLRVDAESAVVEARYSLPGIVDEIHVGGGFVWLEGSSIVGRFDPTTGQFTEVEPSEIITSPSSFEPIDFEGARWSTDANNNTLTRLPIEDDVSFAVVPLPARPHSMVVAADSLWIALHRAGTLVRFDPAAELPAPVTQIVDDVFGEIRLHCTGTGIGPVVLLDADTYSGWPLTGGSWSLVQHELSNSATVCSYDPRGRAGSPDGAVGDAAVRATDLAAALDEAGIEGPYVMAAHGHGVFSTRLFHQANPDHVAGIVLIDPVPIGYTAFNNGLLTDLTLEPDDSPLMEGVGGLGDTPLIVIGHDPQSTFLHEGFQQNPGATPEIAQQFNDFWQDGLDYYAGLSTDSTRIEARGSNHVVIWYRPDVVVEAVLDVLESISG